MLAADDETAHRPDRLVVPRLFRVRRVIARARETNLPGARADPHPAGSLAVDVGDECGCGAGVHLVAEHILALHPRRGLPLAVRHHPPLALAAVPVAAAVERVLGVVEASCGGRLDGDGGHAATLLAPQTSQRTDATPGRTPVRDATAERVGWGSCPRVSGANGMWRSLVAHLTGGQGVAGSNPVIPTESPGNLRVPGTSSLARYEHVTENLPPCASSTPERGIRAGLDFTAGVRVRTPFSRAPGRWG